MQTKASFSNRGQAREFAQFEALEKRLERWSFPKIRKEMNIIARDILRDYQVGGVGRVDNIALQDGRERIEETLKPIYDKTIKQSIRLLKKQNPDIDLDIIEKKLRETYSLQAKKASRQIMQSTSNIVKKVADKGGQDIEKQLRKKLRKSNSMRSKVISEVEIGSVTAEANDETYKRAANGTVLKTWVTRRDSKVRDPHQYAEGQAVFKEENFLVGGESIPYPRYRGAKPANRINCRCRVRWEKI
jgi:hypothetical protein